MKKDESLKMTMLSEQNLIEIQELVNDSTLDPAGFGEKARHFTPKLIELIRNLQSFKAWPHFSFDCPDRCAIFDDPPGWCTCVFDIPPPGGPSEQESLWKEMYPHGPAFSENKPNSLAE